MEERRCVPAYPSIYISQVPKLLAETLAQIRITSDYTTLTSFKNILKLQVRL